MPSTFARTVHPSVRRATRRSFFLTSSGTDLIPSLPLIDLPRQIGSDSEVAKKLKERSSSRCERFVLT